MSQKIIEKSAWIFIENNLVLSTRSFDREKFYFPGGKLEKGESKEEALIREIREELTVSVIPESISFLGTFEAQADNHVNGVLVKMHCFKADYKGKLEASSEIEEIAWLSYQEKHKSSEVDYLIFDWLFKNSLIQ